jgi:hypothetical protein
MRASPSDAATTFWAVMVLKSAKAAGLRVDQAGFDGAKLWLSKVTDPDTGRINVPGSTAFPPTSKEALVPAGILARIFTGEDPRKSLVIRNAAATCLADLGPDRERGWWYFASLALFQVGGPTWKTFHPAMKKAIVGSQRLDGDEKGSWEPVGAKGATLGRVGTTALMTMCLEVYYRYARVFGIR